MGTDGGTMGTDGGACSSSALRPGQRDAHDAAFLPGAPGGQRAQVLVFGGDAAPFDPMGMVPSVYLDEVWSYDVACGSWKDLGSPQGPGKRGNYAAVLDSKRQRMLVIGGRKHDSGYEVENDVWAFDVNKATWTELMPAGTRPQARQGHRIGYDAAKDRVLLYGGNVATSFGGGVRGDTYELSFATSADGAWRQLKPTGDVPSPRQDMATALDEKRSLWLLFGGASDFTTYSQETWAFDLSSDTWQLVSVAGDKPSSRFSVKMIYDKGRDRMVLFGGHDPYSIGLLNDTWAFSLGDDKKSGTFTRLKQGDTALGIGGVDKTSPERRNKQSLVPAGDAAWLFGGITDCGPIDDVWTLDLAAGSWQNPWKAQTGETCARRAQAGQKCQTDCGQPL